MCKIKMIRLEKITKQEVRELINKSISKDDLELALQFTNLLDEIEQEERAKEYDALEKAYSDFIEYNEMCSDMLLVNYIPIATDDFKTLLEGAKIEELRSTHNGFYIKDNLNREFNIEAC